jgi:hypothetical protein
MTTEPDGRPLVVTVTIRETEPAQGFGPNQYPHVAQVRKAADWNGARRVWHLSFADFGRATRDRLRVLFDVADEFDIPLELSLERPESDWRGPVLAQPTRDGAPRGAIDPDGVDTLLVLEVRRDHHEPTHLWWIAGEPAIGTHPALDRAWAVLRDMPQDIDPFAPVGDMGSLESYGGPGEARVRGFWRGRWVQAEFSRGDSAQERRWLRLGTLLDPWSGS